MNKIVGQMAVSDFPLITKTLPELCKHCDEVYIRFDKTNGDRNILNQIPNLCGDKLKQIIISDTPWDKSTWREEMLHMLRYSKADVVLSIDQDEIYTGDLGKDIHTFSYSDKNYAMFMYDKMPTEDNMVLFDGNTYPLLPHCKMFKWRNELTFTPYKNFAVPTNYVSEPYYIPETKIAHYAFYNRSDRLSKINNIIKYYPTYFPVIHSWTNEYVIDRFFETHGVTQKVNNKSFVIYSTNFGNYDYIQPTYNFGDNVQWIMYTDDKRLGTHVNGWTVIQDTLTDPNDSPRMRAKYYKIKAHELNFTSDYSIFIDSNIKINNPNFIKNLMYFMDDKNGISICKHQKRNCVYDEAPACLVYEKNKTMNIMEQVDRYKQEGMPNNYGLWWCGMIMRNTKNTNVSDIENIWWDEINKNTPRDQLSLPFILWKNNIKIDTININPSTIVNIYPHRV